MVCFKLFTGCFCFLFMLMMLYNVINMDEQMVSYVFVYLSIVIFSKLSLGTLLPNSIDSHEKEWLLNFLQFKTHLKVNFNLRKAN